MDLERLKATALAVRTRNLSSKRGHPKYSASITSEEERVITDGALECVAEIERLRSDADRLRKHPLAPERCPVCEWTNINLMNYGTHDGESNWMCHGCAADQIAERDSLRSLLSSITSRLRNWDWAGLARDAAGGEFGEALRDAAGIEKAVSEWVGEQERKVTK